MKTRILGLLLVLLLCVAARSDQVYHAPDWFTDRCNLGHIASNNEHVALPMAQRWHVKLGGPVRSSVIGAFDMLFLGADDKLMYALSPQDGSVTWTYQAEAKIHSSATAVAEGKGQYNFLWFTDESGQLYSLDTSDGSERWKLPGGVGTFTSATNYVGGMIVHTYMDTGVSSKLRVVSGSTGNVSWESGSFNVTTATPMHGAGMLVQGLTQGGTVVRTFNPVSGQVNWTISDSGPQAASWTSGTVDMNVEMNTPIRMYFSTRNSHVRAVSAMSGQSIWETTLPGQGPVTGIALTQERDSNFLVVSQDADLYALHPRTGSILWRKHHDSNMTDPTSRQTPRPAIYGDYAFHVEGGNRLVATELSTGAEKWSAQLDASTVSSPTVGGSTVYIATSSGSVYAFSPKPRRGRVCCS
ncbi:MAG: PQQ-like beta-propeller repeat protein [Armatimonadota bacterium]|nr:MAG: PQQ-like beta-propeller repeat protein [Armatimonadota bacterium]